MKPQSDNATTSVEDLDRYLYKTAVWTKSHWMLLAAGLILIVAVILGVSWYRHQEAQKQVQFSEAFYTALTKGTDGQVWSDLEKQYGDLPASQWVDLQRFTDAAQQKAWPQATELASTLAKTAKDSDIRAVAQLLQAMSLENDGKREDAIGVLDRVSVDAPAYAPLATAEKARLLALSGNRDEAKKILEALLEKKEGTDSFREWVRQLRLWIEVNEQPVSSQ